MSSDTRLNRPTPLPATSAYTQIILSGVRVGIEKSSLNAFTYDYGYDCSVRPTKIATETGVFAIVCDQFGTVLVQYGTAKPTPPVLFSSVLVSMGTPYRGVSPEL